MVLDARGQACPAPVLMTKKQYESMEEGAFEVLIDSEVSKINVCKYLAMKKAVYQVAENGREFVVTVVKGSAVLPDKTVEEPIAARKNIVLYVTGEAIGEDAELGRVLMTGFLKNIKEMDTLPGTIIFVNAGVKITTAASAVVDDLKLLEGKGVEILNCGTCLDFFKIPAQSLLVGSVTDAYTVVQRVFDADKVIRL